MQTLLTVAPLIVLVVVIGVVSVLVNEIRDRLHTRRVNKAVDAALALVQAENADFDVNALRCRLEADRQRRHAAGSDDDQRPSGGSFLMAA